LQKALVSAYGNVYGSTYDVLDNEKIKNKVQIQAFVVFKTPIKMK
jgi:hypothetical protein